MKVHHVRYENDGFYLTIDNIRGYFNFSNNLGPLTMLFADIDHQYQQISIKISIIKYGKKFLKLLMEDMVN